MRPLLPIGLALIAATMGAACTPSVQMTSGAEYIARAPIMDPEVRRAAAIEPRLSLPARIGVARLEGGRLSIAPSHEAAEWDAFTKRHTRMGTWVPVNPPLGGGSAPRPDAPLDAVRRLAARQHLDYVLIYEIGTQGGPVGRTPFALADITLIGGLVLPTRTTQASATASAAFVDVRNGYPLGTVAAAEELDGLARSYGAHDATQRLRQRAGRRVAGTLLPQVDAMLTDIAGRAELTH